MLAPLLPVALLLSASAAAVDYNLRTTEYDPTLFTRQPYVSNGYIGQRVPAVGFGYQEYVPFSFENGTSGWPLFDPRFSAAMVAGFYDQQENTTGTNFAQTGGEQPISTIPTWSSLLLTVNGSTYNVGTPTSQISNYSQSMSIEDGVVETSLLWTPKNVTRPISLRYELFAHRTLPNLGVVRLDVEGLTPGSSNVTVTDLLDGTGAWRTTPVPSQNVSQHGNTIITSVQPNGISNVTAVITSLLAFEPSSVPILSGSPFSCFSPPTNASTASRCYSFTVPANGKVSVFKYVGIASTDAFADPSATALNASVNGNSTGYAATIASHRAAWSALWEESDIIIPGNEELQLATRASLFHLLSNVRQGSESTGLGDNSIAPAGLTSDSYAGQIFWDADVWMFPPLLTLFPSYASSINNFRTRQLGAAKQNAVFYNSSGALYPWTGARFGNATGVGPAYDYEYHLNNDIGLAQYDYFAATGNLTWLEKNGYPILEAVSQFWAHFVTFNASGDHLYHTRNETDPDEYANFVNDAVYTNAGLSVHLKHTIALGALLNKTSPANWSEIADKIAILTAGPGGVTLTSAAGATPASSGGVTLEYDGFNGTTSVKQADVVLLPYPLEFPQSETQALVDLDYYALATSPSGPGMTYSIFSIDSSALSKVGCASYTYLLASSQPYSRAPYYQFSEQTSDIYALNGGTNPAFTFLTGHGGFLQSLTHGYSGYRSRLDSFYLDPSLPPQLTNFTLKGMEWRGSKFDVQIASEYTTIFRRSGEEVLAPVEIGLANVKSGNYSMRVGEYLSIPTRQTYGTLVEGNLAQCTTVLSNDTSFSLAPGSSEIVAGQYSLAAIDGSNSTVWQPLTNATSSFVIDIGYVAAIKGVHLNWGINPALSFALSSSYDAPSPSSPTTLVTNSTIAISTPYDAVTASLVTPRVGNLTDLAFASNATGRYWTVSISGSYARDGKGATLAELALISTY